MEDERLLERTVESTLIHHGSYLDYRVAAVEDADGHRHTRQVVVHPGAVAMIPILAGEVLMVRQYRTPAAEVMLELPAGTLDHMPDGSIEDPDVAAPRELGEETGYRAATWRKLGSFYTAPGFATELMHLYLATDLVPVEGYSGPAPDERLDLRRIPIADAVRMAETQEINDAKSKLGLFWLQRLIDRGELSV
jgi:ADP-ribose pyrophosphatase